MPGDAVLPTRSLVDSDASVRPSRAAAPGSHDQAGLADPSTTGWVAIPNEGIIDFANMLLERYPDTPAILLDLEQNAAELQDVMGG